MSAILVAHCATSRQYRTAIFFLSVWAAMARRKPQARMAGGTVPVTAPRIPEAAPKEPSRISDFDPAAGAPGTEGAAGEPDGLLPPAAAGAFAPERVPAAVFAAAPGIAAALGLPAWPGERAADGAPAP